MAGNNTDEALVRGQAETANGQGNQKHHNSTLIYISENIFTNLFGIALISLVIAWLTGPT